MNAPRVAGLAARLREARLRASMSQDALARQINVGQRLVTRWETGLNDPSATYIVALAVALGVSTDHLLGMTDARLQYAASKRREAELLLAEAAELDGAAN